ncbi:hypothetical protein EC988_007255, partial [Linderina pennispora]
MNGTLRDNILFGRPFDKHYYDEVLNACALSSDIERMPNADMTEITNQGTNLSGGQRARLSLARALYSQADIYLFDGIFAAVDAKVAKHIWQSVLSKKGLLQSRTRILVSDTANQGPCCYDKIIEISSGTAVLRQAGIRQWAKARLQNLGTPSSGELREADKKPLSIGPGTSNAVNKRAQIKIKESKDLVVESGRREAIEYYVREFGVFGLVSAAIFGLVLVYSELLMRENWRQYLHSEDPDQGMDKLMLLAFIGLQHALYANILQGVRFVIREGLYILPLRTRIQASILKGMAKAKVSEYWKGSTYRFISITRSSERAIPEGIPGAIEAIVVSLGSVLFTAVGVFSISPMATAMVVCIGAVVAYTQLPKRNILQPL